MDLGLNNKVAVVLAGTSGLGLAVAQALLAEGARVAISGRDRARLVGALGVLSADHGERVFGEPLDVTDKSALRRHLEAVREQWGTVHVLVTNAGGPPAGTALDVNDDDLDAAYRLTLRSAVHAVQTVLPWMREQRFGRIIGLTSISVRQPIVNLAYSNIMRTGLTAYFKSLSDQVAGDGVLVNSVCTGLFGTDRLTELFELRAQKSGRSIEEERQAAMAGIPAGRIGEPREFGEFVCFLASERCSYLNGAAVVLDGGLNRTVF